jgi:hypothetical protein
VRGAAGGALWYTMGTVAIGILVVLVGTLAMGTESLRDIAGGTAVAVALQVAIFWTLFVWALPDRQGIAYSIGVVVRLVTVALMAFIGVSVLGLSAAPTLLSMVACLFGSTLLEALFLQRRDVARAGPGAVTMR